MADRTVRIIDWGDEGVSGFRFSIDRGELALAFGLPDDARMDIEVSENDINIQPLDAEGHILVAPQEVASDSNNEIPRRRAACLNDRVGEGRDR